MHNEAAQYDALLQTLLKLDDEERHKQLKELSDEQRKVLGYHWRLWARRSQLAPPGDWRTWLILAGRGFGKTRAGAEWVRAMAAADPDARIALVAGSLGEARAVMVEGESGILAVSNAQQYPVYQASLHKLSWPNGAVATLYSAAEPESLRGPQHSHAWCDEIGKWDNASSRAVSSWDNLMLGLRLGDAPQVVATTTPRAVPLVRQLADDASGHTAITRGRTEENREHLPDRFVRDMRRRYGRSPDRRRRRPSSTKRTP
jgi:phage terminase large subunit-like protein